MNKVLIAEYELIEHALQRLMWTEQKKFAALLDEHHLTLPQFLVLVSLHRLGTGCPIGKLAAEMFQAPPTMTDIVDRLEKRKLVSRERVHPKDRRKVVVALTASGRRLLDRTRNARRQRMVRALGHLSAPDRRAFLRLLTAYLEIFEKENV